MGMLTGDNIAIFWLVFGIIFIALEAFSIPGIGFLFAGLGAITIGGLLAFGVADPENLLLQLTLFLVSTSVWAAVLWIPLKRFMNRNPSSSYNDVVGKTATVIETSLKKGTAGKVTWSGTNMKARLSENSPVDEVETGKEVIIESKSGIELIVTPK